MQRGLEGDSTPAGPSQGTQDKGRVAGPQVVSWSWSVSVLDGDIRWSPLGRPKTQHVLPRAFRRGPQAP